MGSILGQEDPLEKEMTTHSRTLAWKIPWAMDCSMPSFPVLHHLLEFLKLMSTESVMLFNHLILFRPLLLLPSAFPSIRVFSKESALCIRWPKYWKGNT